MSISAKTRRWTRLEYERLIDIGVFRPDERLELIAGRLTVREQGELQRRTAAVNRENGSGVHQLNG